MQKISQSRKISAAVLVLYSLLYLCLIFHFHPTNVSNGDEHFIVNDQHNPSSSSHQALHCEVCHILSAHNFIPASDYAVSKISFILFDNFNLQSAPLQELSFNYYSLRAPPLV